jgi:hypothetical protein
VKDEFELDGGESTEAGLSSASMVGPLDPVHDPRGQLGSCAPALSVEDVLVEEQERTIPPHAPTRPIEPVIL